MPVKEAGAGDAHLVQHLRQAMRSLCMTKQCVPYLCQGNASPVYFKAVHPYVCQSNVSLCVAKQLSAPPHNNDIFRT
jgi:hypothetical protein